MNDSDIIDIAAYLVHLKKHMARSENHMKRIDELVLKLMDQFVKTGKGA